MGGGLAGAFRLLVAVIRDQSLLAVDDPEAGRLLAGDQLILMAYGTKAKR
jgi:hypothetical protein